MFQNCCRCCLATDRPLIPVSTDSSHNDDKTLEDYLNILLNYGEIRVGSGGGAYMYPSAICLRCSKALQVAYHFMQMSMESKTELEESSSRVNDVLKVTQNHMGNSKLEGNLVTPLSLPESSGTGMGNPEDNENKMNMNVLSEVEKCKLETDYKVFDDMQSEWKIEQDFEMNWGEREETQPQNNEEIRTEWGDMIKLEEEFKKDPPVLAIAPTDSQTDLNDPKIERSFKCCYCEETFAFHESLIEHTQRIHKKMIPFKCKICSFYTCFIESLWKHYKKNHELDDLENRLYRTKELLAISAEVEPPYDITLKCKECDFQTHTQNEIDEHLSVEHDILEEDKETLTTTYYNCPSCYRQFCDKTSVKIHFSMSHNPQQALAATEHTCEKCGKKFDRKAGLVAHERYCELRDPVPCNFCDLKFSTVFKYEQHLHLKHSVDVKHECEICQKTFKSSNYLAVHRRRHNERYYQCNLCPKNYINNAELQVHLKRIHSRVYHKMCSICKKTFAQSQQLREHMKTDHKKKSIPCSYCEFTSTSKFAIEVHQYRHTGRPYKCKVCPKQYVLRKDIKLHSKKVHGIDMTDEELAAMFMDKHGYVSRFDAFSKHNNNLEIDIVDEMDLEMELKEFNLTFEDILKDLFSHKEDGEDWQMK